jgi:hypothetical protein
LGGAGKLAEEAGKTEARTFRSESSPPENLPDGRPVVRDSPQGTRFFAYAENGKITRCQAEDSSGNSRPVILMKQSEAAESADFDLPLSDVWDPVRVLDNVMLYCVHDSGRPLFFPPDTTTTVISPSSSVRTGIAFPGGAFLSPGTVMLNVRARRARHTVARFQTSGPPVRPRRPTALRSPPLSVRDGSYARVDAPGVDRCHGRHPSVRTPLKHLI